MVITIAGGGSTFTAGIVKSIALRREELEVDEIRLFDINKERQDKVAVVVDWVLHKELNTDIKLVVTTDVQQAYTDASFVFAQMRVGGYAMREQDEKIPLRHGCVGQETCGCGGMAYGMRTIFPMIKLIESLGGEVAGIVVLIELAGLKGRERLSGYRLESAICYEGK
jgi:maltose-6'-phosphate glucosidase